MVAANPILDVAPLRDTDTIDDATAPELRAFPAGPGVRPREQLRFLLRYAVLAPSTHNTQPWRFELVGDTVHVLADGTRLLPTIDPDRRQLHISCGAALLNLRVAIRRFGFEDLVQYLPDPERPDLLARVWLGPAEPPHRRDLALFAAIPRRRTNRAPFLPRPVGAALAAELASEAAAEGAWLERLHPHGKLVLAEIIAENDERLGRDPAYREELAQWLVPRGSGRRDGVPMSKRDVASTMPVAGPMLVRHVDHGVEVAQHERQLVVAAPMIGVLGTAFDAPRAWLAAGEALEAVMLRATHRGLGVSFLNQAVESRDLRAQIARACKSGGFPQLVLRFGYGPGMDATPRRPLEEVVVG